jgi:hypothetical protein
MILVASVMTRGDVLTATRHSRGRWAGKLSPADVMERAAAVSEVPETVPYLRARNNQELLNATDLACDGVPQKKTCSGTRVRLADGTRASSCWAQPRRLRRPPLIQRHLASRRSTLFLVLLAHAALPRFFAPGGDDGPEWDEARVKHDAGEDPWA